MSIIKMAALPLMLFCEYGGFKFCMAHVKSVELKERALALALHQS